MDDFTLLIDLHKHGLRQGPGGDAQTEWALHLAGVDRSAPIELADIGCGTGASTLVLARQTKARIRALDFLPEFLEILQARAEKAGVSDRITTIAGSMDNLPFHDDELDVLWSEGAIYNIGFEKGVAAWRRYLKPGGILVASEITWITDTRPTELQQHWDREYPEINVASAKISVLEKHGYSPIGYFVLPEACWLDQYYRPMQERFEGFLNRHGHSDEAQAIVEAEQKEIALYEANKEHVSYGVYIARKMA